MSFIPEKYFSMAIPYQFRWPRVEGSVREGVEDLGGKTLSLCNGWLCMTLSGRISRPTFCQNSSNLLYEVPWKSDQGVGWVRESVLKRQDVESTSFFCKPIFHVQYFPTPPHVPFFRIYFRESQPSNPKTAWAATYLSTFIPCLIFFSKLWWGRGGKFALLRSGLQTHPFGRVRSQGYRPAGGVSSLVESRNPASRGPKPQRNFKW